MYGLLRGCWGKRIVGRGDGEGMEVLRGRFSFFLGLCWTSLTMGIEVVCWGGGGSKHEAIFSPRSDFHYFKKKKKLCLYIFHM